MLLIPANIEDMVRLLPRWELRTWKEQQETFHVMDSPTSFAK